MANRTSKTGLYYLNSRYYDPETGRFVNAYEDVSAGKNLLGNNMFIYCIIVQLFILIIPKKTLLYYTAKNFSGMPFKY